MTQNRKTPVRRTPEQQIEHHRQKMEDAQSKLAKVARAVDTRRKVVAGAALIGLADAGDAEALQVLARIKAALTRPQDRMAFGLGATSGPTEAELVAAIEAALAAHQLARNEQRSTHAEVLAWRIAVVAWEKLVGRGRLKDNSPEARRKKGFGAIGELLAT